MKVKSLYPIIAADNPQETIEFYKNLGFEIKHDATTKMGTHIYVLSCDDLEIEVMETISEGKGPVTIPAGLYGFRMNVDDIEAATEELKQKGATIIAGPIETESGINLLLKDNQGINITLIKHIKKH